jgi:hypothetical protein
MRYPPKLLAALKKLGDDFEEAIRADERKRLLAKFRAETGRKPVAKPEPLYPITDMHGEPLQETAPQPTTFSSGEPFDYVKLQLNETHRIMLHWMSKGFMAVPTLAGHANIKKQSVYTYLCQLEEMGFKLERKSTGNIRGGYRLIYRLAKAA